MNSSEDTPHVPKEAQELISNISQLMAEAEEMLNDSTSHHAEETIALLASHAEPSPERLMEKYLSLKGKLARVARRTDETIRTCPYESLAVALGIGLLVGAGFCRRSARSGE